MLLSLECDQVFVLCNCYILPLGFYLLKIGSFALYAKKFGKLGKLDCNQNSTVVFQGQEIFF